MRTQSLARRQQDQKLRSFEVLDILPPTFWFSTFLTFRKLCRQMLLHHNQTSETSMSKTMGSILRSLCTKFRAQLVNRGIPYFISLDETNFTRRKIRSAFHLNKKKLKLHLLFFRWIIVKHSLLIHSSLSKWLPNGPLIINYICMIIRVWQSYAYA